MKQKKSDKSPIVYYVSGREKDEWVLFIHAAFVNHNMFKTQFEGAGHCVNMDVPEEFNRTMEEFWSKASEFSLAKDIDKIKNH